MTFNRFKVFSGLCLLTVANASVAIGQLAMSDTEASSGHTDNRFPSSSSPSTGLSGRIQAAEGSDLSRLRVQVFASGAPRPIYETNPNHFGSFEISPLPVGIYEIRLLNWQGTLVYSQTVQMPHAHTLILNLEQIRKTESDSLPVSLYRLQHKIPKQALKEYIAAHNASSKGEQDRAIAHLQKAIEIDPGYFEARNNLGVQWMRKGNAQNAVLAFEQAIAIDPADSLAETNLSVALLSLGRFAEAEAAARAGLRADGLSARARLYLAISLLEQNKARKEAVFHLSKASEQLEPARKLLEQLTKLEDK